MATLAPSRQLGGLFLPAHILKRPDLSSSCKLLLATLYDLAQVKGFCWPSQRYLSENLGVCRRSIQGQLKTLIQHNLVRTQKSANGKTLYVLHQSLSGPSCAQEGAKVAPLKVHTEAQKLRACIKDIGSCLAEPFMIGFKARYANEKQERCSPKIGQV